MTLPRQRLTIGQMVPGAGTFLGLQIIPVFTEFMILTDRADGKLWQLCHTVENGRDYFTITDDINTRKQPSVVYGPYDGPFLPNHPDLRFFIRDGRIGYEQMEGQLNQSQRILSRKLMQRHTLEVIVPSSYKRFGDELGYQRIDFGA